MLQVEAGVIRGVQAFTDAMDAQLSGQLTHALTGCPFHAEDMEKALQALPYGASVSQLIRQQL